MNSLVIMRGAFFPVSVVMAWTTVTMEATRGVVVSSVFHFSSAAIPRVSTLFLLFDEANFFIHCSEYVVVLFEPQLLQLQLFPPRQLSRPGQRLPLVGQRMVSAFLSEEFENIH